MRHAVRSARWLPAMVGDCAEGSWWSDQMVSNAAGSSGSNQHSRMLWRCQAVAPEGGPVAFDAVNGGGAVGAAGDVIVVADDELLAGMHAHGGLGERGVGACRR